MENIFRDNVAGDWSSGEDEGAGFAEEGETGLPGMVVQVLHCSTWRGCSVTSDSLSFQERILEQVAISYSRGLPNPGIEPVILHRQVDSLSLHCLRSTLDPGSTSHITVVLELVSQ